MATQPLFDMSKAAPVANSAPLFDMSKAQPISGQTPTNDQPEIGHVGAVHEPTTYMGKIARWVDSVSNDIKYGTDETGIGTVLKKMGAHGVYSGNSEAVGDFMASLPLGLLKATKGGAEVTPHVLGGEKGKTWQGVKDLVGGGIQAVTMPAAFVAPEETALSKEGLLSDAEIGRASCRERV